MSKPIIINQNYIPLWLGSLRFWGINVLVITSTLEAGPGLGSNIDEDEEEDGTDDNDELLFSALTWSLWITIRFEFT